MRKRRHVEEMARVLGEHDADVTSYDAGDLHGCTCGHDTSDWDAYYVHQAEALRAAIVGSE